ncbi:hypothetical protein M378DRAFT_159600 [Amanita muscaria Koide BX008]|uniref:Uncharacterized protein n=1 Tax=Amanita muscaria (strain Koide BX008) TaxID=946122 RepID=A0A0C2XEF9_AMAMK|nr:hypothetical protein M378DRAFT_159600 [Amanita muscaria Koide BX008]
MLTRRPQRLAIPDRLLARNYPAYVAINSTASNGPAVTEADKSSFIAPNGILSSTNTILVQLQG